MKKFYCTKCNKELSFKEMKRSKGSWKIKPLTVDKVNELSISIEAGKGEKDRVVPRPKLFNDKARDMLPFTVSRVAYEKFIHKLGLEVLNKDIHSHSLRHFFGSFLANSGRPLHEVQMLMGHARLETTGIYLHADPKNAIKEARDLF